MYKYLKFGGVNFITRSFKHTRVPRLNRAYEATASRSFLQFRKRHKGTKSSNYEFLQRVGIINIFTIHVDV